MSPIRIDYGKVGPQWGCSCPAFRQTYKAEQIIRAMAKAQFVTVKQGKDKNSWIAWTDEKNKYDVVLLPESGNPSGVCKHAIRVSSLLVGEWLDGAFVGAAMALNTASDLTKENKKLQKEIDKLDRT